MHLFQNIRDFVNWYYQPTFEHQERSIIVEVCMTFFGKLLVTLQRRVAILSDVDVSQPHRTRGRGHQGRKRIRHMRENIKNKMVLAFGMNEGDTREKVG